MKFNFIKIKSRNRTESLSNESAELDEFGFTKSELLEYDNSVEFYYTNIINSIYLQFE